MNFLSDVEAVYPQNIEAERAAELIGDILSNPRVGKTVVDSILLPGEQPTTKNLTDRLRIAFKANSADSLGLTPKRLLKLQSALELFKFLYFQQPAQGEVADDPSIAAKAFQSIAWEPVEKFAVLSLDTKHRILSYREISSGTETETYAQPREIFRTVIQAHGTRCIIAHNHPSGSLSPSPDDISLTKMLLDASKVMNIPILDHLIVSRDGFCSLRQTTALWQGMKED
ncbi:MAG: JAB domain-containing protein [Cyanobacteria bacterium P01_D01_bin.105]